MHKPDNTSSHNAEKYNHQIRLTIPHYDDIHNEILNFVKVQCPNPKTWLDTGCGTGSFVRKAQDIFPDTEFFIADPSEGMLSEAKKALNGCRYTIIGSCGTSEIPATVNRRFDIITAIQCHHYLSQEGRADAGRSCYSLLNNGGFYITSENIRPFSEDGIARSLASWGAFQRDFGRSDAEVKNHLARFDHEYFPITVIEHLQGFRDAGFPVAEILWISGMQGVFWCRK
jgi:tRNA (cmo5U34)-methyltransferase